jgi:hypothetical protein
MAVRPSFPVARNAQPEQGSKGTPVNFDFTLINVVNGDLMLEQGQNGISFVQSIWIDNRLNAQAFVITFLGLSYTIQVRAGRQGTYPVYNTSGDIRFTATSNGAGIIVPTIMFNFLETPWWQDV